MDEVLGTDSELLSPNSNHKKIELDSTFGSLVNSSKLENPTVNTASIVSSIEEKTLLAVTSPTKLTEYSTKSNDFLPTDNSAITNQKTTNESLNGNNKICIIFF